MGKSEGIEFIYCVQLDSKILIVNVCKKICYRQTKKPCKSRLFPLVFVYIVRVSYRYDYPGLDLPRFAVLNEQLLLVDLIRTGTGKEIVPVHVGTPYSYEEARVRIFGCPVEVMEGN